MKKMHLSCSFSCIFFNWMIIFTKKHVFKAYRSTWCVKPCFQSFNTVVFLQQKVFGAIDRERFLHSFCANHVLWKKKITKAQEIGLTDLKYTILWVIYVPCDYTQCTKINKLYFSSSKDNISIEILQKWHEISRFGAINPDVDP